jgi:ankyrin repeat protein
MFRGRKKSSEHLPEVDDVNKTDRRKDKKSGSSKLAKDTPRSAKPTKAAKSRSRKSANAEAEATSFREQGPEAAQPSHRHRRGKAQAVPAVAPAAPEPSWSWRTTLTVHAVESDPCAMLAIERALALCDAAEYGSASVVRELCSSPRLQMYIDQGVNVHATTALMSAAMSGRADTALVLLQAGAEVDATDALGRTALMFAVTNGAESEPASRASSPTNPVPQQPSPSEDSAEHVAATKDEDTDDEVTDEITQEAPPSPPPPPPPPVTVETVLLRHGADPFLRTYNGWNALMLGCMLGKYNAVGTLLEAVAESAKATIAEGSGRRAGREAKATIAEGSGRRAGREAREHGAGDSSESELQSQREGREAAVSEALLVFLSQTDPKGKTALDLARQQQHAETVALLELVQSEAHERKGGMRHGPHDGMYPRARMDCSGAGPELSIVATALRERASIRAFRALSGAQTLERSRSRTFMSTSQGLPSVEAMLLMLDEDVDSSQRMPTVDELSDSDESSGSLTVTPPRTASPTVTPPRSERKPSAGPSAWLEFAAERKPMSTPPPPRARASAPARMGVVMGTDASTVTEVGHLSRLTAATDAGSAPPPTARSDHASLGLQPKSHSAYSGGTVPSFAVPPSTYMAPDESSSSLSA